MHTLKMKSPILLRALFVLHGLLLGSQSVTKVVVDRLTLADSHTRDLLREKRTDEI